MAKISAGVELTTEPADDDVFPIVDVSEGLDVNKRKKIKYSTVKGYISNFLQLGTGAVTRTAQDKMRDIVDVKDFGAIGDGSTDDRNAFNNAISALATGGTLNITPSSLYYKVTDYVTISKSINVNLLGEVRSTDSTKNMFLVTANGVTFDGTGTLSGPGSFQQVGTSATAYGGLIKFAGTNTTTGVIKNSVVRNINIVNPPWSGVHFLYARDSLVSGCHFSGGPDTAYSGTNHFDILAIDCVDTTIKNNTSKDSAAGGNAVQFFCNTNLSLSYTPCIVSGNIVDGPWEKLIYQNSGGAQVVNNKAYSRDATPNKHLVQVGTDRSIVSNNTLRGSIAAFGPSGAIITGNIIYDYTFVGIHLGMKTEADVTFEKTIISGNVIKGEAPSVSNHVYEAIRISSDIVAPGYDIKDVIVKDNIIIDADTTESSSLGAISVSPSNASQFAKRIKVIDNIISCCGSYGISLSYIMDSNISGNTVHNPGGFATGSDLTNGWGIFFTSYSVGNIINGNKFIDDRTGAEHLASGVVHYGAGTFDNNRIENNGGYGFTATVINVGNPDTSTTRSQLRGNYAALEPLTGNFTLTAAATWDITNPAIDDGTYSKVLLVPTNASSTILQGGANAIYVSSIVDKTKFVVSTAGGGNAAGTETFFYEIIQ